MAHPPSGTLWYRLGEPSLAEGVGCSRSGAEKLRGKRVPQAEVRQLTQLRPGCASTVGQCFGQAAAKPGSPIGGVGAGNVVREDTGNGP